MLWSATSPGTTACTTATQDTPPRKRGTAMESDAMFLAKLVGISFGGARGGPQTVSDHNPSPGAAVIKYGSLLTDVPFNANAALALLMVAAPPVVYAALLAQRGQS